MSRHSFPAKTEYDAGHSRIGDVNIGDGTKLVTSHLYEPIRAHSLREEPLVQPIALSSTYRVNQIEHFQTALREGGRLYIRLGSPTCDAAEAAVNQLEGGAGSVVFGSGMAAISSALLAFVKTGDHVVACYPLYSGTYDILLVLKERFNIEVTWVGHSVEEYHRAIRPNTTVLYGETPCNPLGSILDLEEFGKLGSQGEGRWVTMVDSTYASPYLQKPIEYGVDIVLHSATKYLGGHSDLCAGVATSRTIDQWRRLAVAKHDYGGLLSPFDASLLLRGLKTLHVRMDRQCNSAERLAEYLESRDDIVQIVYYPGLRSNPGHVIAKRQMKKFGGMISFEIRGGLETAKNFAQVMARSHMETAKNFAQSLKLFGIAVSMGGVGSLVQHPASMTHGPQSMTEDERRRGNIVDGLIRLSVGAEDIDDLLNDVTQALDKVKVTLPV